MTLLQPTGDVPCEAKGCTNKVSTHIFGPECEAQTGQLMYLCRPHAESMTFWIAGHMNDPVDCPQHGTIGKVKDYLILKEMS